MVDEATTLAARDAVIAAALRCGRTVVVDDTNLTRWHRQELTALAERHGASARLVVPTRRLRSASGATRSGHGRLAPRGLRSWRGAGSGRRGVMRAHLAYLIYVLRQ